MINLLQTREWQLTRIFKLEEGDQSVTILIFFYYLDVGKNTD